MPLSQCNHINLNFTVQYSWTEWKPTWPKASGLVCACLDITGRHWGLYRHHHNHHIHNHLHQPGLECTGLNIPGRHWGLHEEKGEKKKDWNRDLRIKTFWWWWWPWSHPNWQRLWWWGRRITWTRVDIGALFLRRQCFQRQSLSWPQKPAVIALLRLWK